MNLFMSGNFKLRSGQISDYKIECDALTPADWLGLAVIARRLLPSFCCVEGVPRGGLPFAQALKYFASGNGAHPLLIAEDVCTTGGSMERFRETLTDIPEGGIIGVCVFAREATWPSWVRPLWPLNIGDHYPLEPIKLKGTE